MKKLLILMLVLPITMKLFGHTCHPDTAICPNCQSKVGFCVTTSMYTSGTNHDFQKFGAIGCHYEELINGCSKCHFSGFRSDFDTIFSQTTKKEIEKVLAPYKNISLDNAIECEIAAEIHKYYKSENQVIANIYLTSTYYLKRASFIIKRKRLQDSACVYFIKALEKKEFDIETTPTINYLIGELYRRIGLFDKSIAYFDLANNYSDKEEWLTAWIKEQKELTMNKDDRNSD